MNYLPIRITANKTKDGRYRYPRMIIIAGRNTCLALTYELKDMKEYSNEEEYVIDAVKKLIKILLAKQIGIKLIVSSKLKAIDDIYNLMFDM